MAASIPADSQLCLLIVSPSVVDGRSSYKQDAIRILIEVFYKVAIISYLSVIHAALFEDDFQKIAVHCLHNARHNSWAGVRIARFAMVYTGGTALSGKKNVVITLWK